jgi:hypothetical protein
MEALKFKILLNAVQGGDYSAETARDELQLAAALKQKIFCMSY